MANVFALIKLILAGLSLWEGFLTWAESNYSKEIEERRQQRQKALENLQGAKSEDEFDKAMDDLVSHKPAP